MVGCFVGSGFSPVVSRHGRFLQRFRYGFMVGVFVGESIVVGEFVGTRPNPLQDKDFGDFKGFVVGEFVGVCCFVVGEFVGCGGGICRSRFYF